MFLYRKYVIFPTLTSCGLVTLPLTYLPQNYFISYSWHGPLVVSLLELFYRLRDGKVTDGQTDAQTDRQTDGGTGCNA